MDFINDVIMTRTSVRNFTGETISKDKILKLVKAGMAAPSAVNVQPWEFIIVTDKAKLHALRDRLPYAKMLDKAAVAIVVCGNPQKDDTFAKDHWIVDCSAATENILLAAHAIGLGAVWTAVHPDPDRLNTLRTILGIPQTIIPLNVIPVGIPLEVTVHKDKYNPQFIHYENW